MTEPEATLAAAARAAADPYAVEPGHEWVYRLTAFREGSPAQTAYYLSAYQARGWRDRLRAIGCGAAVTRVPAEMFVPVSDRQLDLLAEEELAQAQAGVSSR